MNEFEIVPASPSDIPLLADYRFAMFVDMNPESDLSGIKGDFLAAARRYYEERLAGADELSLVARRGGEPVGCGTIMFQLRPPHAKHLRNLFGYILNVYVRPEFRKRGVASAIMRALHEEARRRGARRVGLHASAAGAPVYRRLGYVCKESYMEVEL
jgi:ribosomal protein S18 acetylase RimI-like enzyme